MLSERLKMPKPPRQSGWLSNLPQLVTTMNVVPPVLNGWAWRDLLEYRDRLAPDLWEVLSS
jgi:hypothetical protein